jgi:hypothetical protein
VFGSKPPAAALSRPVETVTDNEKNEMKQALSAEVIKPVDSEALFADIMKPTSFTFGDAFGASDVTSKGVSAGPSVTPTDAVVPGPATSTSALVGSEDGSNNRRVAVDKLCGACVSGDVARAARLLDAAGQSGLYSQAATLSADPSAFKLQAVFNGSDGRSPLYYAAGRGHVGVVQLLLEKYPLMVGVANKYGTTALSWACFNGQEEVVRCLLARGAKAGVNEPSKAGDRPLTAACARGHLEIAELLLEEGADPSFSDHDGCSPLYRACLSSPQSQDSRQALVKTLLARLKARRGGLQSTVVDKATLEWASAACKEDDEAVVAVATLCLAA